MRPRRNPKSIEQQLQELEDHLFLHRSQLRELPKDPAYLRAIAAQLRVLLCYSSQTEGLLWRMLDATGESDAVWLPPAGTVNQDESLNRGLTHWILPFHRPRFGSLGPPVFEQSLREVIKKCHAAYVLGSAYTHEELIRAIAEQIGSSHSDEGIEPRLEAIEEILFNNLPVYFQVLAMQASLALQIGERVLRTAEARTFFSRRRFSSAFTIAIVLRLLERPLGTIPLFSAGVDTADLTITGQLSPASVHFKIIKGAEIPVCLSLNLPDNWPRGYIGAFALAYDHANRQVRVIGAESEKVACVNLGFVDVIDFAPTDCSSPSLQHYCECAGLLNWNRQLSIDEVAQIPEFIANGCNPSEPAVG